MDLRSNDSTFKMCEAKATVQIQSLAEQIDFLGFPIIYKIGQDVRVENYLCKSEVQSTNVSSISCTNMGNLSMSFGCKGLNGSGVTSLQSWILKKGPF